MKDEQMSQEEHVEVVRGHLRHMIQMNLENARSLPDNHAELTIGQLMAVGMMMAMDLEGNSKDAYNLLSEKLADARSLYDRIPTD